MRFVGAWWMCFGTCLLAVIVVQQFGHWWLVAVVLYSIAQWASYLKLANPEEAFPREA